MTQSEFEKQLSKADTKRRLIEGALTLVFFVIFIVSWSLREATKEVIVHEGYLFIPSWEEVNYDPIYLPFILLGVLGAIGVGCFLLSDCLFCRYETVEKDSHYITIHRTLLHNIVYIDGKEVDRLGPFFISHVVETKLPGNVKVTVSFSRTVWSLAHISFSDDTPSVEI